MAFPAEGGSREQLADGLSEARSIARTVKRGSQRLHDASAAGDISARGIVIYMDDIQVANDRLAILRVIPGLAAYAKEQYDDAGFDIVAEFVAMTVAIDTVVAWINANIPQGPRWLEIEEAVNGRLVERMLSPAQTASLRPELLALIATID